MNVVLLPPRRSSSWARIGLPSISMSVPSSSVRATVTLLSMSHPRPSLIWIVNPTVVLPGELWPPAATETSSPVHGIIRSEVVGGNTNSSVVPGPLEEEPVQAEASKPTTRDTTVAFMRF